MSAIFSSIPTLDRTRYDAPSASIPSFAAEPGLSEELVREISRQKQEPAWMLDLRLKGLALFLKTPLPAWGPALDDLKLDEIVYFARPDATEANDWNNVPPEIRATFEKIGIPQAEREYLSGAGAQFDSDIIYHNLKKEWADKGVIFENMDAAVEKYPALVQKYFMTSCIPAHDHKFIMLHTAVWSGGTFIYVPPRVKVEIPLQAYFRMNTERGGQFEHTLIIADAESEVHYIEGCSAPRYDRAALHAGCVEIHVLEGATVKYTSIENWSKNTYNLNTKRALVDARGTIEWVNGNMGSGTTMLYPSSVLRGEGARSRSVGIAVAGAGQHQDTGAKAIHVAPRTTSTIHAKSISLHGGTASYRGLVRATPTAVGARSTVVCDALIIDPQSRSCTYPTMRAEGDEIEIAHEARVGKIGEEEIFYCMSRGLSEQEALNMIVGGFIEPIVKEMPFEYALELNKLIAMEMTGAIG